MPLYLLMIPPSMFDAVHAAICFDAYSCCSLAFYKFITVEAADFNITELFLSFSYHNQLSVSDRPEISS